MLRLPITISDFKKIIKNEYEIIDKSLGILRGSLKLFNLVPITKPHLASSLVLVMNLDQLKLMGVSDPETIKKEILSARKTLA